MKIVIEVIPHHKQRYSTLGDYWFDGHDLQIRVSDMADERMNFAVMLHDLVEVALCIDRDISEPDILAFDQAHPEADDPGHLPDAPYHKEHVFAECIERLFAQEIGLNWKDYDRAAEAMFE